MKTEFAYKLKKIRSINNLTQKQLAEVLGVNQSSIARWESGLMLPNISIALKLSKNFNVSCNYLLGLKTTPKSKL